MTNENFGDGGFSKASKQDGGGSVQVFATVMHMEGEHDPRINLGESLLEFFPSMHDYR